MISFGEVSSLPHVLGAGGEILFAVLGDRIATAPMADFGGQNSKMAGCPYCGVAGVDAYNGPGGWTWVVHECGTSTANMGRTRLLLGTTVPGMLCFNDNDREDVI